MLYLGLIPGDYIGWGICSRHLVEELGKLTETTLYDPSKPPREEQRILDGAMFHAIGDHHLSKVFDVSAAENYGYTFFENVLADVAQENARQFDRIFAGSTWCLEQLAERGIHWSDTLIQGIDPASFHPVGTEKPGAIDFFVIFSGGKFELRKGQDIVIKAVGVLQDRHPDVLLVTCWHNGWSFSMNTMVHSPHIGYREQKSWNTDYIQALLHENGIDLDRTEMLPRIPQDQMRKIYACTDVGLFPNRCEGGTNLVLMEYMACGKPVVAAYTSGHKDVLTARNSLPVYRMRPFEFNDTRGRPVARWEDPDIEEIVEKLEYAYQHRNEVQHLGWQAGEDMKQMTWQRTAMDLVKKLDLPGIGAEG